MSKGLTVKKEDNLSEWYSQIVSKADFMEHTRVSGCMVFKHPSMFVWKKIQNFFDKKIETLNVKEVYFPLLIPESLLIKEKDHIEGFAPEVAWVDYGGDTKLGERLAIRPTSETVMYDSFKKWIRSHRDLPIKINQWCNIVRWEFKHPMPFIRTREFLWQEGHTLHKSKKEAEEEVYQILDFYENVCEDLLAIPILKGVKSEKEKFAGADLSASIETFFLNGKGLQMGTSHFLGQNFSKAFDVKYFDENEKELMPFTNSWGLSTRTLGALIMFHGDNKGMVFPPKVAPIQIIIIPIFKEKNKKEILKYCDNLCKELKNLKLRVEVDFREKLSPGFKFNEYEMKGVPLRFEVGEREVKNNKLSCKKRYNDEKFSISFKELKNIPNILNKVQEKMFEKAKKELKELLIEAKSMTELIEIVKKNKVGLINWCGTPKCEENIKKKTGAKSGNILLKSFKEKCAVCENKIIGVVRIAKYY